MKLLISSAAITIIQGSTGAFADNSLVSSVDSAYKSRKTHLRSPKETETVLVNNECAFSLLDASTDIGVLGCNAGFTCVQDESSSTGGRCASIEDKRELQTCVKCQGTQACKGLTLAFKNAFISCGSCIGDYSVSWWYLSIVILHTRMVSNKITVPVCQ